MTDYTIWDEPYPFTQLPAANAGEPIRFGNIFNLTAPLSGWSSLGGRLWVDPSNLGDLEPTFSAHAYLMTDLTTPVISEATCPTGIGGWTSWTWDTPFDMPDDETGVLIAVQFGTTQRFLSSGLGPSGAILAADTINLQLAAAAGPRAAFSLSGGAFTLNFDGPMYGIDIVVSDGGAALLPIPITAMRLTNEQALITWEHPLDAPEGITLYRAPGAHTTDGDGIPFGQPGYDPLTIVGAEVIADGLEESPYNDETLDGGLVYTYFVYRTGEGA